MPFSHRPVTTVPRPPDRKERLHRHQERLINQRCRGRDVGIDGNSFKIDGTLTVPGRLLTAFKPEPRMIGILSPGKSYGQQLPPHGSTSSAIHSSSTLSALFRNTTMRDAHLARQQMCSRSAAWGHRRH